MGAKDSNLIVTRLRVLDPMGGHLLWSRSRAFAMPRDAIELVTEFDAS